MLLRCLSRWQTRSGTAIWGISANARHLDTRTSPPSGRLRHYSQDEDPDETYETYEKESEDQAPTAPRPLLGSVASAKPSNASLAELVECIPETGRSKWPSPNARLLLMLTPQYASHVGHVGTPRQIVDKFLKPRADQTLEVITAVVDRLPSAGMSPKGQFGFAYALHGTSTPLPTSARTPYNPEAQKPGSLSFGMAARYRAFTNIQIPLAQTIFSTGMTSSLARSLYTFDAAAFAWNRSEIEYLESITTSLPQTGSRARNFIHMPLLPLTPARVIGNSMGNIVRTLSSSTSQQELHSQSSAEPQPASAELEAAVTAYFDAQQMLPEPVKIWALVLPAGYTFAEIDTIDALLSLDAAAIAQQWSPQGRSTALPVSTNTAIRAVLMYGGKLCRVLSGGGGWGKKAGLLSLDPDTQYSTRDLRGDQGWQFDFDEETESTVKQQQKQALGDIVKAGDHVMFFIAPRELDVVRGFDGSVTDSRRKMVFGALPSTVDEVQMVQTSAIDKEDTAADTAAQPKHFEGLFGALSEGGLACSVADKDKIFESKLDVPFGFLVRQNEAQSKRSAQDHASDGEAEKPREERHTQGKAKAKAKEKSKKKSKEKPKAKSKEKLKEKSKEKSRQESEEKPEEKSEENPEEKKKKEESWARRLDEIMKKLTKEVKTRPEEEQQQSVRRVYVKGILEQSPPRTPNADDAPASALTEDKTLSSFTVTRTIDDSLNVKTHLVTEKEEKPQRDLPRSTKPQ